MVYTNYTKQQNYKLRNLQNKLKRDLEMGQTIPILKCQNGEQKIGLVAPYRCE